MQETNHQIIKGDAIAVLTNEIVDKSIDLIFADPPYNIGKTFNSTKDKWKSQEDYLSWCYEWIELCIKKLKPNGSFYLMAATQYMPYLDIFIRNRIHILSRIVWSYDSSGVQAKKHYGSMFEPILYCVMDKNAYTFNAKDIMVDAKTGSKRKLIDYRKKIPRIYNSEKVPGNVWNFSRVRFKMKEYYDHPTQKPVELLKRIIKASSNQGDLILDPFSGTFTTSFVAKSLNRNSIGIEIDNKYVDIGKIRLNS